MQSPSVGNSGHGRDKAPCVSVVVPVFNDDAGVTNLLGALRLQTRRDFEVLVVDNGSLPPIKLGEYADLQVRLVQCPTPGSYAARNAGAAAALGQVLAFTDADCIPDPAWVEHGATRLLRVAPGAVVGGEVRLQPPDPRTGVGLYQYLVGFQQERNITAKGFSVTANLFCTREQFERIGAFDTRLLSGGDLEWGRRAARMGIRTVFVPEAVVTTRPRISFASAMRQARRVAAGRMRLETLAPELAGDGALVPHRNAGASLKWILFHPRLSVVERIRVLGAATSLRVVATAERLRLKFGGGPERR